MAAHEIGHAPGGQTGDTDHAEQGIMIEGFKQLGQHLGMIQVNPLPVAGGYPYISGSFEPVTVRRFRKAKFWSDTE